jgi:hypothetical protein
VLKATPASNATALNDLLSGEKTFSPSRPKQLSFLFLLETTITTARTKSPGSLNFDVNAFDLAEKNYNEVPAQYSSLVG